MNGIKHLGPAFQMDVSKNTLNDSISVQHKKEIICYLHTISTRMGTR